jgi:hypothetical protein
MITCTKDKIFDDQNAGDYLMFGHFYGECRGEECKETFMLHNQVLYEDIADRPEQNSGFKFVALDKKKYELVKDLWEVVPDSLWYETKYVFGCPDCMDQGGFFVRIKQNQTTKSYYIDAAKRAVPPYLHVFMDSISSKISYINKK